MWNFRTIDENFVESRYQLIVDKKYRCIEYFDKRSDLFNHSRQQNDKMPSVSSQTQLKWDNV